MVEGGLHNLYAEKEPIRSEAIKDTVDWVVARIWGNGICYVQICKKMIAQYYTSSVLVLTFVLILSKYDNTAVLAACEILRIYIVRLILHIS